MTSENYWGDLDLENLAEVKTPADILKEQGDILTKATNGILEGKVTIQTSGEEFNVYFDLISPYLGDYEFTVIKLEHPIKLYPLTYTDFVEDNVIGVDDEEYFSQVLKSTLSSKETHRVVATLVSQSRNAAGSLLRG